MKDDKVFHYILKNVFNDEALNDDKGNDWDVYGLLQDTARNNKLVLYEIPRREENVEVLIEVGSYNHWTLKVRLIKFLSIKDKKGLLTQNLRELNVISQLAFNNRIKQCGILLKL
jgi:hypothetical protein